MIFNFQKDQFSIIDQIQIQHRDEHNFGLLLDRPELTIDVANTFDNLGRTPLYDCLDVGSPFMAR